VEAPGGEETEAVTPNDEAMCQEKVTGRPQCDRSGSEDTTQVEVAWSKREVHGRRRRIKRKRNMTWGEVTTEGRMRGGTPCRR
jgi:hypothetical protein